MSENNRKKEKDEECFILKNGQKKYYQPGEYVRPLGYMERCFGTLAQYKLTNTVVAVYIKSREEFHPENVRLALNILMRKYSNLQLCLGKRRLNLWFRRMHNPIVNMEVMHKNDMDAYHELLRHHYDLWNGPLWKVGLVFPTTDSFCFGKEAFTVSLIFSVTHFLTDGSTSIIWGREVVKILNAMNRAAKVTELGDSDQFHYDKNPLPVALPIEKFNNRLKDKAFQTRFLAHRLRRTLFKKFTKASSFSGAIPTPFDIKICTKVIFNTVDTATTKKLIAKCKQHKISFNSCMTNITNYALLQVAQNRSTKQINRKKIVVGHAVDTRRYLDAGMKEVAGCHLCILESKSYHSLSQDFWESAESLHSRIKDGIDNDHALKVLPLSPMFPVTHALNWIRLKIGTSFGSDSHYFSTNLGNLTNMLPDPSDGDVHEITHVMRSTQLEHAGKPFSLGYQTYRGKLMINLDYVTNTLTDEVAKELLHTICLYISSAINDSSC